MLVGVSTKPGEDHTDGPGYRVLDINGDGYDDLMVSDGFHAKVYINRGGWFGSNPIGFKAPQDPVAGGLVIDRLQLRTATIMDINGDGRDDIIIGRYNDPGTFVSNGEQFTAIT